MAIKPTLQAFISDDEPAQLDLDLQADYGWFHVMRPRLMDNLIEEIGDSAWAVYCIIKCHANHHTGVASPSQDRIAKLTGKSVDTVARATKKLVEAGLIQEKNRGRHKEYLMLETAPITDRRTGEYQGTADWPYTPKLFAAQIQALKASLENGLPPGCDITINLTVNMIQQRDHGTVNIAVAPEIASRPDMRETIRRLKGL